MLGNTEKSDWSKQLKEFFSHILFVLFPFLQIQSASKLLSRIVVPENINYQTDNKKDLAAEIHDYTYGIVSSIYRRFKSFDFVICILSPC